MSLLGGETEENLTLKNEREVQTEMKSKMMLKVLALALAILMLVPLIASCGEDKKEDETATGTTETSSEKESTSDPEDDPEDPEDTGDETNIDDPDESDDESEDESDDPEDPEEPEKRDLKGYIYKAYVTSKTNGGDQTGGGNAGFYTEDFWVDEELSSTDVLPYTVFERNSNIENDYNCKIVQVDATGTQVDEIVNAYQGGVKYELAIILATAAAKLAADGLLLDIAGMENVDLSSPYYDQNSITQLSLGGRLFFFSGDMNISTMDNACVTIYNPVMWENLQGSGDELFKTSPFEMVDAGTWTVGNMIAIANAATANTSGNLDATNGDMIGYYAYMVSGLYLYYGCGERLTTNDEDGYPAITIGTTERSQTVYDFLFANIAKSQNPNVPNGGSGNRKKAYDTGNTLFTDLTMWDVRKSIHNTEGLQYRVLPIAKFDEAQAEYNCVIYFQNCCHLWAVPKMCSNLDKASYMLQVMADYSGAPGGTMEAYYVKTLQLNTSQDADSSRMIRLIRNSLVYDIDIAYNWGGKFMGLLTGLCGASSNTFASTTNMMNLEAASEEMNITLDAFKSQD